MCSSKKLLYHPGNRGRSDGFSPTFNHSTAGGSTHTRAAIDEIPSPIPETRGQGMAVYWEKRRAERESAAGANGNGAAATT
jgi:hypothetical protein